MNPQRRQWLEQSAALLSTAAAGVAGLSAAGCSSTAPDVAPASPKAAGLPAQAAPAGARALAQARLSPAEQPPAAPREWRAAWVASVAHIDWPKQAGLSAATLRAQILDIVQRSQAMGLNALIVQVRPAADALYRSNLEPP
ncbi:MAG: hypothetical protein ACKOFK_07930, partial [Betaproteobacteria bacterium]